NNHHNRKRNPKKTILVVEKNLSKDLIHKKIQKHCNGSIKTFTDDYTIYIRLEYHPQVIEHQIINHSEKEYAEGENHVNNCENRHSLLKPYLNIFRGVSKTKP
ncbi:MAG: transposase, partial [Methanobacterium sp.]